MNQTRKMFLFLALPLIIIFAGLSIYFFTNQPTSSSNSTANTSNDTTADCSQITSPVDLTIVKGILYPGQYRGEHYKAHGGFGFQGLKNEDVTVKAPIAAKVIGGSRYIERGETQYLFDFKTDCGLEYRFDHLKTLPAKFQTAADGFPAPMVDDSRTTDIKPNLTVGVGDVIATAVGFGVGTQGPNVSFDFGVYDRRQKNEASKDPTWAAEHEAEKNQTYYGVCWFDLLPAADAATVRSLPAVDFQSGKTSDYCKP